MSPDSCPNRFDELEAGAAASEPKGVDGVSVLQTCLNILGTDLGRGSCGQNERRVDA